MIHYRSRGRSLVCCLVACLLGATDNATGAAADEGAAMREARRALAAKKRRLVFNNDGDDHLGTGPATPEAFLASRLSPLRGSHVDTVVYCTSRPFGMFTHATRVGDVLQDPMLRGEKRRNLVPELADLGTDPLALTVAFCRENGMDVLWSMRMNDCHDTSHSPATPHCYFSSFKREHPEWLLGTKKGPPKIGNWTAVDFAEPDVRDFVRRTVAEIVGTYDVDGVELDFFRHLVYFRSVSEGGTASEPERDMMTDMVRAVRRVLDVRAAERERPLLLVVRTPDDASYCRAIGLDIEHWFGADLVDVWVAGGDFRLNHRSTSVELGRRYGVPVWCDLDPSIRYGAAGPFDRNSMPTLRSRALGAWAAGASAVYMFNWFNPRHPLWNELGVAETLRASPRTYFANVMGRSGYLTEDSALAGGGRFRRLTAPHPGSPARLAPGQTLEVPFELGEAGADTVRPPAECHVLIPGADTIEAAWNGTSLSERTREGDWRRFSVPPDLLRPGLSVLALRAEADQTPSTDTWDVVASAGDILRAGKSSRVPWTFGRGSPRTRREATGDAMLIDDHGTEPGDYLYASLAWEASPARPAVAEITAQVLSGRCGIILANGEREERVWLHTDRLRSEFAGTSLDMDTTDRYHVYTITLRADTVDIEVDGSARTSGPLTRPAHAGRNVLSIGASTSDTVGAALWRGVRCRTGATGVRVYDAVLSVPAGND